MLGTKWFLPILAITCLLMGACEARGGGRRGGSMGGIFGSWRKYKKPSMSGGSSRRIVSSSPVHTPITKALNEKKTTGSDKFTKNGKMYNNYNTPPLPAGGSYYTNTAAMPGNSIYISQAPPRGAEFGDFLTGYLTGRIMTMGLSPYHYPQQITHVYRDNPSDQSVPQSSDNNSGKVIVINNTPVSTSTTPASTTASMFDSTTTTERGAPYTLAYTSSMSPNADTTAPPYGVICIPLMVNETNSSGNAVQVERIVCYPAPAPPAPIQNEMKSKPVEIAGDIIEQ